MVELFGYIIGLYLFLIVALLLIGLTEGDGELVKGALVNLVVLIFGYVIYKKIDNIKSGLRYSLNIMKSIYRIIYKNRGVILNRLSWVLTIAVGVWLGSVLIKCS